MVIWTIALVAAWLAIFSLWLAARARERRRNELHGHYLALVAEHTYGIIRKQGESDAELRRRCKAAVDAITPRGRR